MLVLLLLLLFLMEGDSCFLYHILPPKPHDISLCFYVKSGSFLVCVFLFCFVLQTERVIYASITLPWDNFQLFRKQQFLINIGMSKPVIFKDIWIIPFLFNKALLSMNFVNGKHSFWLNHIGSAMLNLEEIPFFFLTQVAHKRLLLKTLEIKQQP